MPPTWGTIAKTSYPMLDYDTLPSGIEVGQGIIQDGAGGIDLLTIARWPYDTLFFVAAYTSLGGSEEPIDADILKFLGIWNQVFNPDWLSQPNTLTWPQIEAGGAIYLNGQAYTGTNGVSVLFDNFLARNTVFADEQSTQNYLLGRIQAQAQADLDATVNVWTVPPAPPPYVPPVFAPGAIGAIQNAIALMIADDTRVQNTVNVSTGRVIAGFAPVPT